MKDGCVQETQEDQEERPDTDLKAALTGCVPMMNQHTQPRHCAVSLLRKCLQLGSSLQPKR